MPPQTSHIPRITVIAGERVYLNDGVNSDESIPATIEMDFETRVIRAVHRGRVIPRADYEAMSEVELVDYIEAHNGQVVMPGLIDAHVHINEPGRTSWEGFATATSAACHGGCTTVVDMPLNSIPPTTTVENLQAKVDAARGQCHVDVGFYGGVIPGNAPHIKPLIREGVLGFKCFMIESGVDEFPCVSEADIERAMLEFQGENSFFMFHAELDDGHQHDASALPNLYSSFLHSRPNSWEDRAIEVVIRLCLKYNVRCHIVHLASASAIPLIRDAKAQGARLTVETTFHYLYFDAATIPDGAAEERKYKCCPPIRDASNREQLWKGLEEGVIDYVVSDHSPCTANLKLLDSGNFLKAWGGIASVQFGLPIMWSECRRRGIGIEKLIKWTITNPARQLALDGRKGRLAVGFDGDIVVWAPEATVEITKDVLKFKNKLTPYEQQTLFGEVEYTIVGGRLAYAGSKGGLVSMDSPTGRLLL